MISRVGASVVVLQAYIGHHLLTRAVHRPDHEGFQVVKPLPILRDKNGAMAREW